MLEARELVKEAVPSSWSIQKSELSERAKQHRAVAARSVVHDGRPDAAKVR